MQLSEMLSTGYSKLNIRTKGYKRRAKLVRNTSNGCHYVILEEFYQILETECVRIPNKIQNLRESNLWRSSQMYLNVFI